MHMQCTRFSRQYSVLHVWLIFYTTLYLELYLLIHWQSHVCSFFCRKISLHFDLDLFASIGMQSCSQLLFSFRNFVLGCTYNFLFFVLYLTRLLYTRILLLMHVFKLLVNLVKYPIHFAGKKMLRSFLVLSWIKCMMNC